MGSCLMGIEYQIFKMKLKMKKSSDLLHDNVNIVY